MAFRFLDRWQGRLRDLFPPGGATDELVATLELRDRSLEAFLEPPAWIAVRFENSWVNYGGSEQVAEYQRDGDIVRLRGVIKDGFGGFVSAFTLPEGLRPPANIAFATVTNGGLGGIYITSAGGVQVYFGSNLSVNINLSFSVAP